jgi:hypothetical protein
MTSIGWVVILLATIPFASDDEMGTCELVKTYTLYGTKNTVAFVGADAEPSEKELIACARRTIVDGSPIVYLFNDLARARTWSPVAFGPGPPHEACLGRAHRESPDDKLIYTPQTEW